MKFVFTMDLEDIITIIILAIFAVLIILAVIEIGIGRAKRRFKDWKKKREEKRHVGDN